MNADKTTLNDLAIFAHEEEQSVFHHLDFTRTLGGRDWLNYFLSNPLSTLKEINYEKYMIVTITKNFKLHTTYFVILQWSFNLLMW